MGCDIHCHGEVKINGKWHHYKTPQIKRWYRLFARMANVRNYDGVDPISMPRGIPEDATFITKFDCEWQGADGHSHSYLSGAEVSQLVEWADQERQLMSPGTYWSFEYDQLGYIFGNDWDVKKYLGSYPKGVEEARLIFWFTS